MQADEFRNEFPILTRKVNGQPLIYLDSGATTQLPNAVLGALDEHYRFSNGNVHRGIHHLSRISTEKMEETRQALAAFLNAASARNIVFTAGTTAAINLVASSHVRPRLKAGDNLVVSELEHHSNYLPWLELCRAKGAELRVLSAKDFDAVEAHLDERTRLVAVAHVTNTNGYRFPVEEIVAKAHEKGVPVLVDGAQAVRAERIDLRAFKADFYCVSGHKMFAPTGTGSLYVSDERIEEMWPIDFGGGMISTMEGTDPVYEDFPYCMEAGTGNYAGIIAWKAALDFMEKAGRDWMIEREKALSGYLYERLRTVKELQILGDNPFHLGCVSFVIPGIHPMDAAMLLDQQGVAVRSGHHCAIPAHRAFGAEGSLRASVAAYNTEEDVDRFLERLQETICLLEQEG